MTDLTTSTPVGHAPADAPERYDALSRPLVAALNLDLEKAIYITFLLLAIVTRFYGLGDRVVSHDESLHTQFSYQYYIGDGYVHSPLMHGPTLFHLTAASYWLFGDSDLSARIPVAIFGVLLIALPYFLRDWLGRKGALFVSFLFLISPYLTYYSRYIRHDILLITFALIVFIATWHTIRERRNKYLWWFVAGLALMFATMEAAFIYVAIFGSFLLLRLLALIIQADWLKEVMGKLWVGALVALLGVVLVGVGYGAHKFAPQPASTSPTATTTSEGFAVDPNATQTATSTANESGFAKAMRWVEIVGIGLFSVGLFLMVRPMRPHIDRYPEFDLIVLYVTLLLPLVSPLFIRTVGWNPVDYSTNTCLIAGQETMTEAQIAITRLTNMECLRGYATSPVAKSGLFLIITLAVSILVGVWWDRKRWIIAAVIFHAIFLFFFTSVFTNPAGWRTGMIGSLGYWLEQQGVQRGSQPWYYYLFVTPLYEFLPLILAVLGMHLWSKKQRINDIVWYWVVLALAAVPLYSLANWLFNRNQLDVTQKSIIPGLLVAGALLATGAAYWFLIRRRQVAAKLGLDKGLRELVDLPAFVGFVPSLIWWVLLTWPAYSVAGEKMPWLSVHFTIPMALLGGWYLGQRVDSVAPRELATRRFWLALGLTAALVIIGALALGPLLLGQVRLGDQALSSLTHVGRFLGGLLLAAGLAFLWRRAAAPLERRTGRLAVTLGIVAVLAIITIRFNYMASFVNYDYTNEFMVYAHGAPATKSIVLEQLEELSMRLYGDHSIKVAYDSDVSWPYTWYLRQYPNKVYFGDNATQSLNDSPVVIVGSRNWANVDPFLSKDYVSHEYTFLWWPMEEYRKFSWEALFGKAPDELNPVRRGLGNPDVRQALWDIFWYRDYTKYGEVFGGTYTAGEWPVRHDLRLYIRKDVLADLWDHGVGAVSAAGLTDPYEANGLSLTPSLTINQTGIAGTAEGALSSPRNLAIGPDGLVYVADSGNNRIQVFDADGRFVRGWGSFGVEAGQFNEPWGVAVDEQYVYVADTWNHRIQKFTLEGQFVASFGSSGSPAADDPTGGLGLFFGPRAIVLIGDHQLLVTDTGNHRLQLLDRDGNFLQAAGSLGNQLGQFDEPVGLAVGPDGSIFVADTWNGRVQHLSPELVPLGAWDVEAWFGQSINNKPYLAIDDAGRVYVTDPEAYRVLIFSPSGAYLNRFGQFGTEPGGLGLPNGLAFDGAGNLWLADAGNHRVLKYPPIYGAAAIEAVPVDGAGNDGQAAPESGE